MTHNPSVPYAPFTHDGETRFSYAGGVFSVIEHKEHDISNLLACNDHGRFLFHIKDGFVTFYAVQEIYGSRSEPHITF